MSKKNSLWIGLIFGILFIVMMVYIWSNPERRLWFDSFFLHIPQYRTPLWDGWFHYLALTATIVPMTTCLLILSLFLAIHRYYLLSAWVMINHLVICGIGKVVKQVVARPRPQVIGSDLRSSFSFPSGHVLLAVTLVTTVLLIWATIGKSTPHLRNSRITKVLLMIGGIYILSIMASRIYLGVHFPSDMIGSLLLAISVSLFTFRGYQWISDHLSPAQ